MHEKEFDALLSGFLDDSVSDDQLVAFKEAVEAVPVYRHRFQKELRLHTLLREVSAEEIEEKKIIRAPRVDWRSTRLRSFAVFAVAASIIGMVTAAIFTYPIPTPVGVCLHVSDDSQAIVHRGEDRILLARGAELYAGDRIVNREQGQAMVSLDDGSMLSLEQDTELTVAGAGDAQVTLRRGQMLLEVTKREAGGSPFRVRTPDSTVTVLGTVFVLSRDDAATRVDVYEGKVNLARASDSKSVDVEANQYAATSDPELNVKAMVEPKVVSAPTEVLEILPTDDAFIEVRKPYNSKVLQVEGSRRTSYLRFELSGVGPVESAELLLTQTIDHGDGTLSVHQGSHSDWTEKTLRHPNAPEPVRELARRRGAVLGGRTIGLDVSRLIKRDGVYTLILKLDKPGSHDIWFHSKEGANPPRLRITH